MKLYLLLFMSALSVSFNACNTGKGDILKKEEQGNKNVIEKGDQSTIEGTLKLYLDYRCTPDEAKNVLFDKMYFYQKHKDEIKKTFEVVEKDTIPGKDIILVFFRYSVGAEVAHTTMYVKKIEGKWYIHSTYYSSFDEDPFGNGKGVDGKALLKKADEWEKEDANLWWK